MKILSKHLYIVSTPIGNLDDITLRALEVLKNSDIILCEDTRRSIKLLSHYKIKKKLISYHKFNEKKQLTKIIEYFNEGKILSLISDAGTPLLSDPGRLLVNECIENDILLTPIPGVSSITSAISVSGFKDQFLFYGFLPKTQNELNKVLISLSQRKRNLELRKKMFEDKDDASRYCGLLEAQDFPLPTVELINIEEIKDFCIKLDYECKLVEKNFVPKTAEDRLLIAPPQKNLEVENWEGDNKNNRDIDLNTIKENLEKLL